MSEVDSVSSDPNLVEPHSPAPGEPAPVARVHLTFDLPVGTGVQVTVEAVAQTPGAAAEPTVIVRQAPLGSQAVAPDSSAGQPSVSVELPLMTETALAEARPAADALPIGHQAWARVRESLVTLRAYLRSAIRRWPLATWLFGLAVLLYLGTRLFALENYPIYFFSDEAIHTVRAAELANNGFVGSDGAFLPTYLMNGPFYNLSVSVYVQVLPYLLFGKSVLVTRGVSVLITLLAVLAVGLALRDIFNIPYWWTGVLLLSITPAWFLHSRTAFEVAEMVAFYAATLYFYWLYRCRSSRYLYAAVGCGALAFYTYSPGQIVMLATGLVLLISDWRYHWQNRRTILVGLLVAAVLALPYVRFQLEHPSAAFQQLRDRGSLLVQPVPLAQKLSRTLFQYATALNPAYWYLPNNSHDLARHVMQGYGNLWIGTLPFMLLGLVVALRHWRSAAHRALVLVLLVSPAGAWLADVGITRVLMLVIPAALLTALGLASALQWLERWPAFSRQRLSLGMFVLLAGFNLSMLSNALVNGPTWVRDYGLYGMQYGAEQLFGKLIPDYLAQHPEVTQLHVSPIWANGTDVFSSFFLSPQQRSRVVMDSLDTYMKAKVPLSTADALLLTAQEYDQARQSPKFKTVQVDQSLAYPDGSPGFYVVHLAYVDNIDQILAAEQEALHQLASGQFTIGNQMVTMRYSQIADGDLRDIFDGKWETLVRGLEANPFVLEFSFPEPRPITGIAADFGSMDLTMSVLLYAPGSDTPVKLSQTWRNQPPDPHVEMKFDNPPAQVSKMRVEILNLLAGDTANIHIREFKIQP